MNRFFLKFLVVSAVLLSLVGCSGAGAPSPVSPAPGGNEVLLVGLVAELTGSRAAVGASCQNAALMAVDEVNKAGGVMVGGKAYHLELVVKDNQSDVQRTAVVVKELIALPNVVALIGPNSSDYAILAAGEAEKGKILMITPWSTNSQTTLGPDGKPLQYVFRACFSDPFQIQTDAKYALDVMKAKKAAILYQVDAVAIRGQAELFQSSFVAEGGKVVAFEGYGGGTQDFSRQLKNIQAAGPDLIFLPTYYPDAPLQVQQAKQMGLTGPFLGTDAWLSGDILAKAAGAMEGCIFSTHFSAQSATGAASRFVESYKALYGSLPDDVAALTYDAFGLLGQALKNAGMTDRQAVRDGMAKIQGYQGVTGSISYPPGSGNPTKSLVILQIQGSQFNLLTQVNP